MQKHPFLTGLRRLGLTAFLCGLGLLTACTELVDLQTPRTLQTPRPLTMAEIPAVDWSTAQDVHMLASEFVFSPNDPVFKAGEPYRLLIRNLGDSEHTVRGRHFLRAIAIREIKLTALHRHGDDGHADKPIAPPKADGTPEIPPAKEGARDLIKENKDEAAAGSGGAQEADDPFAAKPEDDEDEDEDSEGASDPFAADSNDEDEGGEDNGAADDDADPFAPKPEAEEEATETETEDEEADESSEAADPFAAKPDADEEEPEQQAKIDADDTDDDEGSEAANPFAAKPDADEEEPEQQAKMDDDETDDDEGSEAANPFAAKPDVETEDDDNDLKPKSSAPSDEADDDDDIALKPPQVVTEVEEDDNVAGEVAEPASEEALPTTEAQDTGTGAAEPAIADEADDKAVVKEVTAASQPSDGSHIDWQPVLLDIITIPSGHEVLIEFVAVRPGSYRLHSGDVRYALAGMFGAATIE